MKTSAKSLLSRTVGASFLGALASAALASPAVAQTEPAAETSDEIVVTAQKREETLQDAPIAVSVQTGENLRQMSATDLNGYARSIPSLSLRDTGTGTQVVVLRGINPSAGEPAVSFYIGETPMPPTIGNFGTSLINPKLIDVERIEVLRGPQGTLYGAGAVGGTIRFIPVAPDLNQAGGFLNVRGAFVDGDAFGGDVALVANTPIAEDRAAVRTALWYRNAEGFITRQFPGGSTEAGGEETFGLRSILAFRPTDWLDLEALVYHQNQSLDGFQDITAGAINPGEDLVQIFPLDIPESAENEFTLTSLTANADLGAFTLTSVSSGYNGGRDISEEGSAAVQGMFGGPPFFLRLDGSSSQHTFTQELRLANDEPIFGFDALVGLYYNNTNNRFSQRIASDDWNAAFAPTGVGDPQFAVGNLVFMFDRQTFYDEFSVFGELTYHLTDALQVTGGIRSFNIENGEDNRTAGFFNANAVTTQNLRGEYEGETHRINLSYDLTDDYRIYAQYSEGFRPGFGIVAAPSTCAAELAALGFASAPTQVGPDSLENYELGARTRWLDDRLTLNLTAFQMTWSDIQQRRRLACGFSLILNSASEVEAQGFELEGSLRLDDWRFGLALSQVEATFQAPEPILRAFAGDTVPEVPEWQATANVEYTTPIGNGWDLIARLDAQYLGDSYVDLVRTPAGPTGTLSPLSYRGETTLVGARLTFRSANWEAALFGTNLLDDVERQSRQNSSFLNAAGRPRYSVNAPRTFGAELRYSF